MKFEIVRAGVPEDCHVATGFNMVNAVSQFAKRFGLQYRILTALPHSASFEMGCERTGWERYYAVPLETRPKPAVFYRLPKPDMGWLFNLMYR